MLKEKSPGLLIPEVTHPQQKDVFFPRDTEQLVQVTSADKSGHHSEESVGKTKNLPFLFFFFLLEGECKPFSQ